MKWNTQFNPSPRKYESSNKPGLCVPDQTMSISEIMTRYARGLPISGQKIPVYNEETEESEEMINYEKLDKIEKIEFQRAHQEKIKNMYGELEKTEKEKKQKQYESNIEKIVQDRINEQQARSQAAENKSIP